MGNGVPPFPSFFEQLHVQGLVWGLCTAHARVVVARREGISSDGVKEGNSSEEDERRSMVGKGGREWRN